MADQTSTVIAQSGVIPYRLRHGRLEIALVTSSSGDRWTIPKGHVEPDMSAPNSAAKEAFEESGLLGDVGPRSVGAYAYEKRGGVRRVVVYLMLVRRQLVQWPEQDQRERCWFTADEAALLVRHSGLRKCITDLQRRITRPRLAAAA